MQSATVYNPPPLQTPEVVYIDEALIAVNKPAGLLTVPGRGPEKQDCLVARLQQCCPEALVVHRLDMETSGIVLFARNAETQSQLGKKFAGREVNKTYIAVVHGKPVHSEGLIDLPLIADWPNRPKQKVDHELGKPSQTRYRVLEFLPDRNATRVELSPITGRSHQLRVHMQALGNPVVGDRLYNNRTAGSGRLLLHAERLDFSHPVSGEAVTVRCPVPFD